MVLWAAGLCYEVGLTQGDIAERMGLSRPSVTAYLQDARARGIVTIEIAPEKFRSLCLARSLNGRVIPISAPAIVSSPEMRSMLMAEAVLSEQLGTLSQADCIIMGISSLRPESTIHSSGFLVGALLAHQGVIAPFPGTSREGRGGCICPSWGPTTP